MIDSGAKVEAMRDGKIVFVEPEDLTTEELCEALGWLHLDKSELHEDDVPGEKAAINEAIKRLRFRESENYDEFEAQCRDGLETAIEIVEAR